MIRPEAEPGSRFTETYLRTGLHAFSTAGREINADFDFFQIVSIPDNNIVFEDDFNGSMDDDWTWMSYYPASIKFWDDLISYVENDTENIFLMLSPWDPHFSFRDRHGHWAKSIYNKNNGGYCQFQLEFFTNEEMISYQINHFKFIIDRWGGSSKIFAWELLNEAENNLYWPGINAPILQQWISETLPIIKAYEFQLYGKNHLWSISSAKAGPSHEMGDIFFNGEGFDFATTHFYTCCALDPVSCTHLQCKIGNPEGDVIGPALNFECCVQNALVQIEDNRPFLESESGPILSFPVYPDDELFDSEYHRNMIWAHFASGASGSGLRWLYTPVDYFPELFLKNFEAMHKISDYIDWSNFNNQNFSNYIYCTNYNDDQLHVMSSSDRNQAIVWILVKDESISPVTAEIFFSNFEQKTHQIQWFDDTTGMPVGSPTPIAQSASFTVTSPEFDKSLVAIVTSTGYALPFSKTTIIILIIMMTLSIAVFRSK